MMRVKVTERSPDGTPFWPDTVQKRLKEAAKDRKIHKRKGRDSQVSLYR
jgi:hypothetical protein